MSALSHHKRQLRLPLAVTLLFAAALAGCITLLALWCQPNALRSVLMIFRAQPLLIVLNALPVGLVLLALTCLMRNVFFAAAVTNLAVCGLSIANRIKLEVRDEPVFPRDFALLKEVGSAMGSYNIRFPVSVIAVVLAATAFLVVLGFFLRSRPFPVRFLRGWLGRILGFAANIAVLAGLIVTVYASNDLYNSFRVSNAYYIPSVFNELGFPYCFCHQFTTYPVDQPEGFKKSVAQAWQQQETSSSGKAVNVIMVMNEAFSDITDDPVFTFADDPLPNLHAMQQDPHAISGHVVVPGFAGGTANTEFDVLTGIQTNALSASTTSAMRVVNRNLDSLFRLFGAEGYHTSFFHPGDDWFYNRENVYRWMGAEETRFADEMPELEYKGRWVTDSYMADLIEEEFLETVSAGKNLFHYTTTIQNHMSYTLDKYGADYDFPDFESSVSLSEDAKTLLRVYTEGARDADAMLGQLWSFFRSRTEPVVLVFFGDHLPYLGDNQMAYRELGMDIAANEDEQANPLCGYETPYIIWANDSAAALLDWDNAAAQLELPESRTISAAFLGAAVLELTGREDANPWFGFLCDLRRLAPAVQNQTCLLPDGTYADLLALPEDAANTDAAALRAAILKWRQWSYYKLRYQEFAH